MSRSGRCCRRFPWRSHCRHLSRGPVFWHSAFRLLALEIPGDQAAEKGFEQGNVGNSKRGEDGKLPDKDRVLQRAGLRWLTGPPFCDEAAAANSGSAMRAGVPASGTNALPVHLSKSHISYTVSFRTGSTAASVPVDPDTRRIKTVGTRVPRGIVTDTSDQGPYGKCLMRRRMTLRRRWSASHRLMIDDVPKRSAAHRSTPKDGSVSHEFHSHRGLERRGDRGQKRSQSDSTLPPRTVMAHRCTMMAAAIPFRVGVVLGDAAIRGSKSLHCWWAPAARVSSTNNSQPR